MNTTKSSAVIINRRISGTVLICSWLFLLAFPALVLNFSLEKLFSITEQMNARINKSRLMIEMEMFREDVDVCNYLDRQITGFVSKNEQNVSSLNAESFAAQFFVHSRIKLAGVIIHGPDTEKITDIYCDSNYNKIIKTIPRSLTLKYFMSRNNQPFMDYIDRQNAAKSTTLKDENNWEKLRSDSDSFWQRQFGLISIIPLAADITTRSVSSKLGGTVYFHYIPFYSEHNQAKRISGGAMLIIMGNAISTSHVLKHSISSADKTLQRTFVRHSHGISDSNSVDPESITLFSQDIGGVHLQTTLPQPLIVHYIQNGAFYPENLEKFKAKMPLMKVSYPVELLAHPLRKYASAISFFSKLLCMAGLIFILHIFLYGFKFQAGVRLKVTVGIAIVSFLPMSLLTASYLTWREFNERFTQAEIEQTLKIKSNEIQQQLVSYLLDIKKTTVDLAGRLENFADKSDDLTLAFLENNLQQSSASAMFFDRQEKETLRLTNSRYSENIVENREENFQRGILASIIVEVSGSPRKQTEHIAQSVVQSKESSYLESEFVNSILNSYGSLTDFDTFKSHNSYSVAPIFSSLQRDITGYLTLRFDRKELAHEFASKLNQSDLRSEFSGFSIAAAILSYDQDNGIFSIKSLISSFDVENIKKQLAVVSRTNSSCIVNQKNLTTYIDYVPRFPLLIAVTANRKNLFSTDWSLALLLFYTLSLLVFIFNLFGKIYIEPILKLAGLADCVSQGNFDATAVIRSGDEFEELKVAFDSMLIGVVEKERLFQFVSEEVINAVKSEDEASLQPGGERLEATILFASVADFTENIATMQGNHVMELLDRLIYVGDTVSRAAGGSLDKVIEGTLMIVYRSKSTGGNHAVSACAAALMLRQELLAAGINTHIGISSGIVLSGRIGSRKGKLDYTVIGDAVNMAARLKGQADKALNTGIIIAPSTIRKAKGQARVSFIDRIPIKGKSRRYPIYELINLRTRAPQ
ncbi:MAG: adenylate/guanylate cyclase domain-containing protein [Candidatus Riflebacteria bacterium]|nr:adenylate/guanylate cyclase domain-containing protein [Candidatus Riflebacteria bacterium]